MQLGTAIGARVVSHPADEDLGWANVVVLVKRALLVWGDRVRQSGKPFVWDALDFWNQPEQNSLTREQAIDLLREHAQQYQPDLIIGATQAMADAASHGSMLTPFVGAYLPHHARPSLKAGAVKQEVRTVAYEGTRKYLGRWGHAIERECARRGWDFVINPANLADADIIVAFRDAEWDGWICQEWKSGVKVVNAMTAGRPIVSQPSAAMRELQPFGTVVDDISDLPAALDAWVAPERRRLAVMPGRVAEFTLANAADRYRRILHSIVKAQAA